MYKTYYSARLSECYDNDTFTSSVTSPASCLVSVPATLRGSAPPGSARVSGVVLAAVRHVRRVLGL